MKKEKVYIVYDERAILMDTDDATVMVICDSLREAKTYAGDYGLQCPVYSYDVEGSNLINEKFECII